MGLTTANLCFRLLLTGPILTTVVNLEVANQERYQHMHWSFEVLLLYTNAEGKKIYKQLMGCRVWSDGFSVHHVTLKIPPVKGD